MHIPSLGTAASSRTATSPSVKELTEEERKQVEELKKSDREVRSHEQAHKAAAGRFATGGPQFDYQRGPDGKRYAVGGHVNIDVSPERSPEATLRKMQQIQRASLAPADPSPQDRRVASQAAQEANKARAESVQSKQDEGQPGRLLDVVA